MLFLFFRCLLMGFDLNRYWSEFFFWVYLILYVIKNFFMELDRSDVRIFIY